MPKDVEVNFDQNSEELKKAVFSLKENYGGVVMCTPLLITWSNQVIRQEWIMSIIDDACNGEYELIAFDTLSAVLNVAKSIPHELAENGMNNLFVFGSKDNYFLARVFNTTRGIILYIGKLGYNTPLYKANKHRLFVRV